MVHTSPHAEVDVLYISLAVCTNYTLCTVSDCCLTPPPFFSYIMARSSYISMRLCLLWTRPTRLVGIL